MKCPYCFGAGHLCPYCYGTGEKPEKGSSNTTSPSIGGIEAPVLPINPTRNYSNLTNKQKTFIKNKIRELGSIEMVKRFYSTDSTVAYFAREMAKVIFTGPKKLK